MARESMMLQTVEADEAALNDAELIDLFSS